MVTKGVIKLESALRENLNKLPPVEALFNLADIVHKQQKLYEESTYKLDSIIANVYITICKKLSQELTETGKILPSNKME